MAQLSRSWDATKVQTAGDRPHSREMTYDEEQSGQRDETGHGHDDLAFPCVLGPVTGVEETWASGDGRVIEAFKPPVP